MSTSSPPSAAATPAVLHQAGRVIAGAGSLARLPELVAERGARRILLICGRHVLADGRVQPVLQTLADAGVAVTLIDRTPPEPAVADVEAVLAESRAAGQTDLVVGLGGGSAIDVAKAVAVLLAQPVTLEQLLTGTPVPGRGLPTVLIPTTAGTGAEATPNSIILVPERALKIGIVSPHLLPDAVILDPLLTLGLPPAVTASTGMDALAHVVECYTSKKGNAFSDLYALEGIRLIARSIRRAFTDGQDADARQDMLMGAYWGGVCIATSSTTAVHALAYPLGGTFHVPHGLSNAMLLPAVMDFNRVGNEARFAAMARAMGLNVGGLSDAKASERFVDALRQLNADLGISSDLKSVGVKPEQLDALVDGAAKVTRLLDNNPRAMTRADLRAIYEQLIRTP
ncbi:MAG TPA: iron-containing alcohol dehydrogenase [Burkholderiaceae bacterium]|nr:iron-containing alcohol dehydrogenase [Burkholderiaceae bacterium]